MEQQTYLTSLAEATGYFISLYPADTIHVLRSILGKAKFLDSPPGRICNVLKRTFKNEFGNLEDVKYFLIKRTEPYQKWAALANIPEKMFTPGLTISDEIIGNISQEIDKAALVIVFGDRSVYYMNKVDVICHFYSVGSFHVDRTDMEEIGFGLDQFNERDPF